MEYDPLSVSFHPSGARSTRSLEEATLPTSSSSAEASKIARSGEGAVKKEQGPSSETVTGLQYKIQLGAYGYKPNLDKFNRAGDLILLKEDGLYKVLTGSFREKETALKKLKELKAAGFDGFVVKYRNGIKEK
jgi:hypothetical protein